MTTAQTPKEQWTERSKARIAENNAKMTAPTKQAHTPGPLPVWATAKPIEQMNSRERNALADYLRLRESNADLIAALRECVQFEAYAINGSRGGESGVAEVCGAFKRARAALTRAEE